MGCDEVFRITGRAGIPDETFQGIPPVLATGKTVGNLTEAYVRNTESLITVNGRLETLCKAHKVKKCTGAHRGRIDEKPSRNPSE